MAESKIAKIMGWQQCQVYDRVMRIALNRGLLPVRVETHDDAEIILYSPHNTDLLSLLNKFPKAKLQHFANSSVAF